MYIPWSEYIVFSVPIVISVHSQIYTMESFLYSQRYFKKMYHYLVVTDNMILIVPYFLQF